MLWLALGGATGAICRYIVGLWMMKRFKTPPIPVAILVVNLLGSFGLGLFFRMTYAEIPTIEYLEWSYLFIATGFFGAFTTFSTFSAETVDLIRQRKWKEAIAYTSITLIGSIVAFLIGYKSTFLS